MADGTTSMTGIWKALGMFSQSSGSVLAQLTKAPDAMHQMASDMNKMKRSSLVLSLCAGGSKLFVGDQLQKDSRSWLSPPDPSPNYNSACEIHQEGTATWFLQGNLFDRWKEKGSLFWIYGKRAFLISASR